MLSHGEIESIHGIYWLKIVISKPLKLTLGEVRGIDWICRKYFSRALKLLRCGLKEQIGYTG